MVAARPGSEAAVRLAKRHAPAESPTNPHASAPDLHLHLHYTDLNVLADELAGYGPEVLVHSPASLRSAVRSRLVSVRDAHTDPDPNSHQATTSEADE